jgi:hypothetical protein
MILRPGEKVHILHRQLHEHDARRHFVGVVEAYENGLARVTGYLFAMNIKTNEFEKRNSLRTRIIPLASGEIIVNVLPDQVQIDKVAYQFRPGGDTVVTDGSDWQLNLTHL